MAVSLKHNFVSAVSDGGDSNLVQPSNWNEEHVLTLGASKILGRYTGTTGAAQEITPSTGLTLDSGTGNLTVDNTALSVTESQISDLGTTIVLTTDIGSTVQEYDADLTGIASATFSSNQVPISNGSSTWSGITVTNFAQSLLDDSNASTARATLDVDQAGTDNSTNVTLAGTLDYLTIIGQQITRNAIDLTTDVTGTLPVVNGGTGITSFGTGVATALGNNTDSAGGFQLYDAATMKTDEAQTMTAQLTVKETAETNYNLTGTDFDPANGTMQYKTTTGSETLTGTNFANGQSVTLRLTAATAVSFTGFNWVTSDGAAPTIASNNDVFILWQDNSTKFVAYVGNDG